MDTVKKRIEDLENLRELLINFSKTATALSRVWDESDDANKILNTSGYPFAQSFDELTTEIADWRAEVVEETDKVLKDLKDKNAPFHINYDMILQTVGWRRFCEVATEYNGEYEDDYGFNSNDEFKITVQQARELGFPV